MDTLPQGHDSARYPFMEVYPDWRLADLEELPLGGLDTCDVHYVPGLNWISLKHVLSHCQGYADHSIPIKIATYTEQQQAIMAKEKVTRWTDTSVYRDRQNSLPRIAARHE